MQGSRYSRKVRLMQMLKYASDWMTVAIAPLLLCIKIWKKQHNHKTMQHTLLAIVSDNTLDSINTVAEEASTGNTAMQHHMVQQLQHYNRKVTGNIMPVAAEYGYAGYGNAATTTPMTRERALEHLANVLKRMRLLERTANKLKTTQPQVTSSDKEQQTQQQPQHMTTVQTPIGTYALTKPGQLPPAPIFSTAAAWKGRMNQGLRDQTKLELDTTPNHIRRTETYHKWLLPWPELDAIGKAQIAKTQEAATWKLGEALDTGETVAVRWGKLREMQQSAQKLGQPALDTTAINQHLWRKALPTLGTNRGNHVTLLRKDDVGKLHMRMMHSQELASPMGLPLTHPIRDGLRAVTESQALSLMGQSLQMGCATIACKNGLQRAGFTDTMQEITYGAAACGIDLMAAAVLALRPNMRYLMAVEAVDIAARAHKAAWKEQSISYFTEAHNQNQIRDMPRVQIWAWTGRCNPFTKWSRRPKHEAAEARRRALEEMHAAFGYARLHKPKIIVGENVSNIGVGSEGQIWRSLLAILHAAGDYEWAWQVLDPTTSLREDVPMNRSRFWYVGVLRC